MVSAEFPGKVCREDPNATARCARALEEERANEEINGFES